MPTSSLKPIFASPLYRTRVGRSEFLGELKSFLLARQDDEYRHPDSPQSAHKALFESRFDLFDWKDAEIRDLKEQLYANLMLFLQQLNGFDQETLSRLRFKNESWYHITHKGGYFQTHTHPLASCSMIYCIDPGDEDIQEEREAGAVMFFDPRQGASMFLDPANRHMRREFSFDALRFRLSADEMVIFPSYLQHAVEPYCGDRPRITIAANFWFALS